MIQYNFCPRCGNKIDANSNPPHCSVCDITYYRNAKPCASVLPVKNGKVLLAKRGKDPFKGAYDIIGGFVEADELPEDAAVREAKEETGLDIKITSLLGTYVDRYGEDGDYTLNLHYIGEIVGGKMKPMDDVASLEWVAISEVPLGEGFQNTKDGLRDLKKLFEKNSRTRIRHTVIFTFYKNTTEEQISEVISRLNAMGEYLQREVGVTGWTVVRHIPETFKAGRAHLLQDCIFPSVEALELHANSEEHKHVVELTSKVCDWMTVDTVVPEA